MERLDGEMELYRYVTGLSPNHPGIESKYHLGLFVRENIQTPTLAGAQFRSAKVLNAWFFDIFTEKVVPANPGFHAPTFKVDDEMRDLIIDLNLAEFYTTDCCRGRYRPNDDPRMDNAYIQFASFLPTALEVALVSADVDVPASSDRTWAPTTENEYMGRSAAGSRINAWHPGSGRILDEEELQANVTFVRRVRDAFDNLLPRSSEQLIAKATSFLRR